MKHKLISTVDYYKSVITELDRNIKLLFISHFLWFMGLGLYLTLWPLYLKELGADPKLIGLITSLSLLIATLTFLPGGYLSDILGRKKLMLFGWLLATPSALVFALAPDWKIITLGIFLYHLSFILIPALDAYIAMYSPSDKLHFSYTFVYVLGSSSLIFSPVIGGFIAQNLGIRSIFYFSFFLYLLSSLVIFFLASDKKREPKLSKPTKTTVLPLEKPSFILPILKYLLGFSLLVLLLYPVNPFIYIFLQEYKNINLLQVGYLGSIGGVGSFLFAFLVEKYHKDKNCILALAITLVITALLLILLFRSIYIMVMAIFLLGASRSIEPLMKGVVATFIDEKNRAWGMGIFNTFIGVSAMIAPSIGGWLYAQNPITPFVLSISWGVLGVTIFWVRRNKMRGILVIGQDVIEEIFAKTTRKL
ncbi:MAG: Multidrug resistance protein MdtG [candidate division WS2 bacterium]|nr:Multidrug resistance protein MdtG [Candidatus Psychracetigena formicireducens]